MLPVQPAQVVVGRVLDPLGKESLATYLQARLAEIGVHPSPFEVPAEELILQSAQGSPRLLNGLLQPSMELAATAQCCHVTRADVQSQLERFEEEEDLALTRLQLRPPSPPPPSPSSSRPPSTDPPEEDAARQDTLEILRQFRRSLR